MQDHAVKWINAFATKTKDADDAATAYRGFDPPFFKPKAIFSDGSLELQACLARKGRAHQPSWV